MNLSFFFFFLSQFWQTICLPKLVPEILYFFSQLLEIQKKLKSNIQKKKKVKSKNKINISYIKFISLHCIDLSYVIKKTKIQTQI